jgi:hypothetical protein
LVDYYFTVGGVEYNLADFNYGWIAKYGKRIFEIQVLYYDWYE